MKTTSAFLFFLILSGAGLFAQEAAPVPTTQPDNARYAGVPSRLAEAEKRVAAIQGKPCAVLFIGDSITARWLAPQGGKDLWEKYYVPRHALDFGVGGDTTQNMLWRLDNMNVHALKPKVVVLMAGTNNYKNTADEVAAGVRAVLAKTEQLYPAAKVILVSILPNKRANPIMMDADQTIKTFADNQTVYYLDLVPLMPPVGDNWTGLSADHLHPDPQGYQIWASAMEPLLAKLLGETPAAAPSAN